MSDPKLTDDLPPPIAARVQSATLVDGKAIIVADASGLDADARRQLEGAIDEIIAARADVSSVSIVLSAERATRQIIAIGSGKGGVGKSTLSANLAVALVAAGRKVGLVDADIYGPSQPVLLGNQGRQPDTNGDKLVPVPSRSGVPMLSMGHLIAPGKAIAWRGPMAGKALAQLFEADWGDVETLLVDLPPGTGDVQLTLLQRFRPVGAIIVSTPQDLALIDAARAGQLFEAAHVPVIGLVENMAGYACPHCGEVSDPFGRGGIEAAAGRMELPFLGRIPLTIAIREASDRGLPPAGQDGSDGAAFAAIARQLGEWLDAQPA